MVHAGPDRRDGADDCIVELVGALQNPVAALACTSDSGLRARGRALGAEVAGARALLDELAAVHDGRARSGVLSKIAAHGAGRLTHTKRSPENPARFISRYRKFPSESLAHIAGPYAPESPSGIPLPFCRCYARAQSGMDRTSNGSAQ